MFTFANVLANPPLIIPFIDIASGIVILDGMLFGGTKDKRSPRVVLKFLMFKSAEILLGSVAFNKVPERLTRVFFKPLNCSS